MAKHNNTNIYNYDTPSLQTGLLGFRPGNSNRSRNYLVSDIASLIIEQLGLAYGNTKISGNVVWLENLDYEAVNLVYIIGGTIYTAEDTVVTLSPADETNSRIDVIYADTEGNVGVIEGQPSENPVRPTVDEETQILYSFVLVEAGATEPANTSDIAIYSDNLVTDWTNNTSDEIAVDFDDVENIYEGTKNISVKTLATGENFDFTNDTTTAFTDFDYLHFYIKKTTASNNDFALRIFLEDEGGNPSNGIYFTNGSYGFDASNTDDYQSIVIPKEDFTGITDVITLDFVVASTDSASFVIDEIRLVSGGYNAPSFVTFLTLTDTPEEYTEKAGQFVKVNATESGLEFIADIFTPKQTANISTEIPLDTIGGHNCNLSSANSNTSYTISSLGIINAYARVLINAASEPTITGATQEGGVPFIADTNMYLIVWNKGTEGVFYYYIGTSENTIPDFQAVTNQGATTTEDVTVNSLIVTGGATGGITNAGTGNLPINGNQGITLKTTNPNNGTITMNSVGFTITKSNEAPFVVISKTYNDGLIHNNLRAVGLKLSDTVDLTNSTGTSYHISLLIDPTINDIGIVHKAIEVISGVVDIQSGKLTINNYSLPESDGLEDQTIKTDGSGTLSFVNSNILKSYTFGTLPGSPTTGQQYAITDANSPSYLGIASGGGSTYATVIYNGTNWIYS